MKKNILYILPLVMMALGLTSCSEDSLSSESIITADSYTQNQFDKWLEANFRNPYNIDFKYRYEEIESDMNYYTVPADMESSIVMAHLLKYLCVETYNEVAGIEFTRSYFPKMFYLIGTWEYRNNGSYILGTAEGGKKILLTGINFLPEVLAGTYDRTRDVAEGLNHYYIKTIHHEFTHILNQTRDFPTSFRQVTPNSYVNDSQFDEPYLSAYLQRGFISAYAQTEAREDFAEMVSVYVTNSAEWWEEQMKAADTTWEGDIDQVQTGRALIEQKLDITRAYMRDVWNIDIDELRDCILRRQTNITSGKIDLTDISTNELTK
ncbi:MAG: putative zinc-binding metallopeptidase [Prevotella sp.]|nr:putative zinc-binding metallopeptidase [Prevotella sp.]